MDSYIFFVITEAPVIIQRNCLDTKCVQLQYEFHVFVISF